MTATETILCPACGTPHEGVECGRCGYFEQTEMPAVEMKVLDASDGAINCTAVCPDCGEFLEPVGGELVCTQCQISERPVIRRTTIVAKPTEPDPITAEFLLCDHPGFGNDKAEPCDRYLMVGKNTEFVCPVCGDSKPYPGMQSPAVKAAASIPVVGQIASAVVQGAENAVGALRKRRR